MNVKNIFSKLFRPSRAQLEQKVAALIAEGKIPEAAQLLLDAGHADAALLKAQWDALMFDQQTDPNLDRESFSITRNRITFALLEMSKLKSVGGRRSAVGSSKTHQTKGIEQGAEGTKRNPDDEEDREGTENSELPVLTEDQRRQLRQLLELDQWQQALNLGKDWSHEMTLLHSRCESLERSYHLGLITEKTHQTTQAQILDALRHFVQHPD